MKKGTHLRYIAFALLFTLLLGLGIAPAAAAGRSGPSGRCRQFQRLRQRRQQRLGGRQRLEQQRLGQQRQRLGLDG